MTQTQELLNQIVRLPLHAREELRQMLDANIAEEQEQIACGEEAAHLAICRERMSRNENDQLTFAEGMAKVFGSV